MEMQCVLCEVRIESTLLSSGLLCSVVWQIATNILKEPDTSIYKYKWKLHKYQQDGIRPCMNQ
jgi:hypothetical protein